MVEREGEVLWGEGLVGGTSDPETGIMLLSRWGREPESFLN